MSVKRKPVFCSCCSMDVTNAVRIRCAQLGPPAQPPNTTTTTTAGLASTSSALSVATGGATDSQQAKQDGVDGRLENGGSDSQAKEDPIAALESAATTRKHDPVDVLTTGPRSDGLVPVCDEFDICGSCFCEGKEVGRHKRWHDYRVVTQHAYPIFTDDWGADEELLLITACQTFGLGNWADIAEHIGSFRTKEEVEAHYLATYIESPEFPVPVADQKLIDQETFQSRKKARLEEAQLRPVPIPPPKPLASAPTCHEIAGFMPGRLEFETEWENDAEALIKDMEFGLVHRYGGDDQPSREQALGQTASRTQEDTDAMDARQPQAAAPSSRGLGGGGGGAGDGSGDGGGGNAANEDAQTILANADAASAAQTASKGKDADDAAKGDEKPEEQIKVWDETDDDLELKLTIMEIYNERINRRLDSKNFIFDRGLLDYKKIAALEKKKPREERDLVNRMKVFARLQTAEDHEILVNGMLYEQALRKHVSDLQEYRQAGLTSLAEIDKYEKEKTQRIALRGSHGYREALLLSSRAAANRSGGGASSRESTPNPKPPSHATHRKVPNPQLTLANSASLQLLTEDEVVLCSELHILPKPYLFIKQSLLREFARCGGRLEKEHALELITKVDDALVGKIWEHLFGAPQNLDLEEDSDMLAAALDEDSSDDDDDDDDSDDSDSSSEEDEGDLMGELQEAIAQQQQMQMQADQSNGQSSSGEE